ncbi:phospho-N-acetylmuramoyl-pentapeptide-transferase [Rickettsiales endosymbiont of Peranema trichophorum]|uniref:phospho-N-acetylmuramoyl-pentapeptide- transferase n=1 Tax=Rickettsiales endosymbiont of Peranema trichophorum TaxID=2486577 RepID=UPI001023A8A8|nr:phospho-N-acetylmuramoyl-pentapeptide-transferase [Rickettsiales endosymbiont of Peranema trichophorum]RZI47728.1 phospho-N-acetylmuramoyl-pentapeptide-transferase [Rickettsiales endosymbiont of Peranema trichophorum]
MLFHLSDLLVKYYSFLNVFKYITFRSGGAMVTALLLSFIFGDRVIRLLTSIQVGGQPIRADGPASHLSKAGTPTMGGILILLTMIISVLLWVDLRNPYVWIVMLITLSYGMIGFCDDFSKLRYRNHKGISGRTKLFWEFVFGLLSVSLIVHYSDPLLSMKLTVPFFKHTLINLHYFYLIFGCFVLAGTSNAVNLTDGLDGLAIVPIMIVAACFGLISYLVGHASFAHYLHIEYVAHSGELSIFCAALIGSGLGFLWYNAPPAQVFMGDVGSLALGGTIAAISIITKHEIVLAITGGLFVIEALSVMLQVFHYKLLGRRIFRMAPIHHHFEKLGWPETKVVIRFWIIAIIFALLGLATLKLR